MKLAEIITRDPERIPPDTTIREAASKMKSLDVGALPVFEGDRLIGMITDRDIAVRAVAEGRDPNAPAREIMSEGVIYCFEDQDAREAAKLMRDRKVRRLIVLNRDKRLVGIVSLGDLARESDDKTAGSTLKGVSQPTQSARA